MSGSSFVTRLEEGIELPALPHRVNEANISETQELVEALYISMTVMRFFQFETPNAPRIALYEVEGMPHETVGMVIDRTARIVKLVDQFFKSRNIALTPSVRPNGQLISFTA